MAKIRNVRNITKFKRSIKAISPVIATLLMIAIAVVASLVVYAWVTGYMGNTTSKAGKAIQIQSYAISGGNLVVYVQNVGQGDVELNKDQSVYINSNLVPITLPATATIPLNAQDTVELTLPLPLDYVQGHSLNIKVTTTDGTFMTATGIPKSTNPTTPATTYAVNFELGTGGLSMNPAAGAQNVGGPIAISATPNTNYVFNQWQSTGSIIITDTASASTTATVSGTGTITATFTYSPGTYQVTVTADPSAAIGGTFSVTYTKGGTVHTNEAHSTSWTEDVDVSTTVTVSNPGSVTGYTFNSYTPTSGSLSSAGTITLTYTQNQALQPIYVATSGEQHTPSSIGSLSNFANMQSDTAPIATLAEADADTTQTWVTPTSDSGSSDNWGDSSDPRDGNTGTYADETIGEDAWSSYLTLGYPSTTGTKVRYWMTVENSWVNRIQVEVHRTGNNWEVVFDGNPTTGQWQEVTFTSRTSDQMRIRVYNDESGYGDRSNWAHIHEAAVLSELVNYRLDQEVQFQASINSAYTRLEIKAGAFTAEGLSIERWNGASWTSVGALTANTVNTFNSISLTGGTLQLRFIDATQSSDTTSNTWEIDYVRLVAP